MSNAIKGPWYYQKKSDAYTHIVRDAAGRFIVSCGQDSKGVSEANAHLIAAAPDMLEALKIAREFAKIASDWNLDEVEINGEMKQTYDIIFDIEAAIAKAEGKS